MGLDDIERLLRRSKDRALSPVEHACLTALMTSAAAGRGLSDAVAEELLASLVAEDGESEVHREPARLSREQLDVLESSLREMTASDGPRPALAERLRSRFSMVR